MTLTSLPLTPGPDAHFRRCALTAVTFMGLSLRADGRRFAPPRAETEIAWAAERRPFWHDGPAAQIGRRHVLRAAAISPWRSRMAIPRRSSMPAT